MVKGHKKRIALWIFGIIALSFAVCYGYLYFQFNKMAKGDIPKTNDELNISNDASKFDPNITNIALLGVDSRDQSLEGRSDSMIILSIDKTHNKLKLSSVMRDTYVNVEGHGMTKITHAYAYGGAALAIKTLNSNFDLNIKDYVAVNFEGLQSLIDSMGGIKVEIKSYEIPTMKTVGINSIGTYTLNGKQALAYARIRHQGNGDFERTDRQRTILTAVFEKIKSGGVTKFPSIVSKMLPYTETSLSQGSILSLGTSIFTANISTVDQVRFPVDGYWQGKTIGGIYYLVADLKATTDQIHKFIYDDQKPVAK